jgi:hypothetical protein
MCAGMASLRLTPLVAGFASPLGVKDGVGSLLILCLKPASSVYGVDAGSSAGGAGICDGGPGCWLVSSTWSSADLAGEVAKTVASTSLLSWLEARESGVIGASAAVWGGSSSLACCCSTMGWASGAFLVGVPLLDSSGVMGRAEGMLRERDRRWGMAGTMRESGRRACLWAGGAVSAARGAMIAGGEGCLRRRADRIVRSISGSRDQRDPNSCQLSWSALGRETE